jgi:hypothetical protein
MRTFRLLTRSVPLALALSLATADARADGGDPAAIGAALAVLAWMPPAAFGVVTDVGVGAHLALNQGRVPRLWSVLGTVTWSIATACWAPVVGVALDSGNFVQSPSAQGGAIAFAATGAAVNVGSLALSLYGLAHPTGTAPAAPRSAATAPLSLTAPVLAPTADGARIVLGGTF